jgi:hypothetical protein
MSTDDTTHSFDSTDSTDSTPEETSVLGDWQRPEPEEETDERHGGFHPLQTGYLVVGLLALGVALMWLLTDRGVMEVGDGSVAFSLVLITAGAVGVIASLGKALRRR